MAASLAKGLSPVRAELSNGGVILVQAKFGLERGRDAKGC